MFAVWGHSTASYIIWKSFYCIQQAGLSPQLLTQGTYISVPSTTPRTIPSGPTYNKVSKYSSISLRETCLNVLPF
jgi:hypothetical protein